jgi:hypothetical protein
VMVSMIDPVAPSKLLDLHTIIESLSRLIVCDKIRLMSEPVSMST